MKRFNVMIAILIIISCNNKNLAIEDVNFIDESKLLISLDYVNAKSVGENHNNQADDNNINVLDIFIFNADGPKKGTLDGYKQFSSGEYKNLEVTATTGLKNIYVVANSKNDNWKGVNTLDVFLNEVTFLKDEALKDFTMLGKLTATLQPVTSVTMAVERVISKIELLSIKTAFKDTPYEGESLKNVKVYLTNVQGAKSYDSDYKINPVILNKGKLIGEDINGFAISGALYDSFYSDINDLGYNVPHYFYAYENQIEYQEDDIKFTRLIIQADLLGNTYYYPINVNQPNYGYSNQNGHYGIKRNTKYKINVTILRPGSTDPDIPIEMGVMDCSLNVLDWNETVIASPEF